MSDRTHVTLTVLKTQSEKAKTFFDESADDGGSRDGLTDYFEFEGVNYGELPFLEELQAAGIAYDSEFSNGDEYGAGCTSCRFTPEGEAVEKTLYDDEDCLQMHVLTNLMDNPGALKQYILAKIEERSVLPWDNQDTYGARYRMRQLVTA